MDYIVRNIRWRVSLDADGIHRTETPEIPIDALREAVINSFAHARYDIPVQHEIDIFSTRISIVNPGPFASDFAPEEFAERDIHSFLRNEVIAHVLYLCKDVETFGSGIKKIYALCSQQQVDVRYTNTENDFTLELSRVDRNTMPRDGIDHGTDDMITEEEAKVLQWLREDPYLSAGYMAELSGKSLRTVNRLLSSLKAKKLIVRVGSPRTGYWKVL